MSEQPPAGAGPSTAVRSTPDDTLRGRVRRFRNRIRERPRLNAAWRIGVGVVGTLVLLLGVLAIPYPGPGWLIVFAGLGILATEFEWAARVLRFVRRYYDTWSAWVERQNVVVKALIGLATAAIVVVTIWLLDGFGLVGGWLGLHWTWLRSPLFG